MPAVPQQVRLEQLDQTPLVARQGHVDDRPRVVVLVVLGGRALRGADSAVEAALQGVAGHDVIVEPPHAGLASGLVIPGLHLRRWVLVNQLIHLAPVLLPLESGAAQPLHVGIVRPRFGRAALVPQGIVGEAKLGIRNVLQLLVSLPEILFVHFHALILPTPSSTPALWLPSWPRPAECGRLGQATLHAPGGFGREHAIVLPACQGQGAVADVGELGVRRGSEKHEDKDQMQEVARVSQQRNVQVPKHLAQDAGDPHQQQVHQQQPIKVGA